MFQIGWCLLGSPVSQYCAGGDTWLPGHMDTCAAANTMRLEISMDTIWVSELCFCLILSPKQVSCSNLVLTKYSVTHRNWSNPTRRKVKQDIWNVKDQHFENFWSYFQNHFMSCQWIHYRDHTGTFLEICPLLLRVNL